MRQVRAWQRRDGRPRLAVSARRWLIVLLMLAFAATGFNHGPGHDHEGTASPQSHMLAAADHDGSGTPCGPDLDGQTHRALCTMASGCAFCVPLAPAGILALSAMTPGEPEPETILFGHSLPPRLRPPKRATNA